MQAACWYVLLLLQPTVYLVSPIIPATVMDSDGKDPNQRLEGRKERLRAFAPPEGAGVLLTYSSLRLRPPSHPLIFKAISSSLLQLEARNFLRRRLRTLVSETQPSD
ncbi:unnamed protein product [Rangifer tarandus platyrhynchus]|uniref:Uncharacterized protein n=1 Tax=Rangifer tarandus platyrhynchus TaxID=3082113 RepID=A0AC59YPS7_RANTA